jgi:sterol desaturase/sphingolipid hydroxylase (fatty acid hydroxylase superfamily)
MSVNGTEPSALLEGLGALSLGVSSLLGPLLAPLAPLNPQPAFHTAWDAMCDRYTEYQISTTGSLIVQVIFYFGCAFPGFIFQFLAFMKQYKVQQNKAHSLAEQWDCLKRVLLSKSFIYVSDAMSACRGSDSGSEARNASRVLSLTRRVLSSSDVDLSASLLLPSLSLSSSLA